MTTIEILATVVVHVFIEGLDESESLRVDGRRSRFEEEVEVLAISAMVVVHDACDSRFFGQRWSYTSIDVRGRDMELDIHGAFEGRR